MKRFAATALAVFAFALLASAAQLSGDWTLTGKLNGVTIDFKCYFDQTGETLDGSCDGPLGSPATTGSITGNKVTLKNILTMGHDVTVVYTGTMDDAGASVKGTIEVGQSSGTFSMTKKVAPPPAAVASAVAPGFTGTWVFTGEVEGNVVDLRCKFEGEGDKFKGPCTYEIDGDVPTTGTVTGNTVTFQNRVTRNQIEYDLTYTGTLDDTETSMTGDIAVDDLAGEFSGKKVD